MAEFSFEVEYDGPALHDGEMAVRDLAPALLAVGDLFVMASSVVYPGREPIAVNIRATAEGSFVLRLALESRTAWDTFVDISGSHGASALANLYQLVGGTAGLLAFIRYRAQIERTESVDSAGTVTVTLDDGTSIDFPADVLQLDKRVEIRRKARDVVAPLHREGVEEVRFFDESRTEGIVVTSDDTFHFDAVEEDEETLLDIEQLAIVEIIAPYFQEGKKWRVALGGDLVISARIDDADFLLRIDRGEPFRKGDLLRCTMRVIQKNRPSGLHSEYTITRVIQHIAAAGDQQLSIPPAAS